MLGDLGRKWVTSVAPGPQGAIAYASGRSAHVRFADGKVKEFQHPRSVEGLAFSPKGMRFGVARYNGVTLHFPAADGKPVELRMGRRAHRRHLFARRQFRRHRHAGECAARLEAGRRQAHAHDRLSGQGEEPVVERQGQMAGELRRAGGDRLAVPVEGRADGQGAAGARHARQYDGERRRLPSDRRHRGDRLPGRHGAGGALRRCQGSAAASPRQRRDQLDDVGRRRPAASSSAPKPATAASSTLRVRAACPSSGAQKGRR